MISRRELLAGATLGLSGLAGCVGKQGSGGLSSTETVTPTSDGVFERVAVEGTTLVIDLAEDTDIDTVNVISPSGELYRRLAVYRGVKRLSMEIDEAYTPGVYEILGVTQAKSVNSVQLNIAPQLEITDVSLASDGRVKFPDGLGNTTDWQVAVAVTNQATGPAFISKLLVLGNVPNPTVDLLDDATVVTGIFDSELDQFYSEGELLAGGESTVLFSDSLPFFPGGAGRYCERVESSGEAEIRVVLEQLGASVSTRWEVQYFESEAGNDCTVRIGERV